MRNIVFSTPNKKQDLFLRAKVKHVGFGGARGGGKSWAVQVKAILLCVNFPGLKALIVRRTYKELQNNHIDKLRPILNGVANGAIKG